MKYSIFTLFVLVLFASSCEEQPVVIPEFDPIETGKVVLVEEVTGVMCSNCPSGSSTLQSISARFPGNVVIVAVHAGFLTDPLSTSQYDFRNPASEALEVFLEQPFKPAAFFNRVRDENQEEWGNSSIGSWTGLVEDELLKEQVMNLNINHTYDPTTREMEIEITALPLVDLTGDFSLSIMITEGEIVDAQDDQFVIVEDYVHSHVLRDIITNFNGDFFASEMKANELVTKRYNYTVPTDEQGLWVEDHLEVVAFIANREGTNEEVLQAAQVHLKE